MSEIVLGTPAPLQDTLTPKDASTHHFADDLISRYPTPFITTIFCY